MKILFVATVDSHIKAFHLRTISQLHSLGNLVDVAANGDFKNDTFNHKYNIPFSRNPLSVDNIKAYSMLKKIINENDYDIISCHTPIASFLARFAARHKKQIKIIYTAHGFHFYKGCPFFNILIYKNMERLASRYTDVLVTINREDYDAASRFSLKINGKVELIHGVGVDINQIKSSKSSNISTKEELNLPHDSFILLSVGEINQNKNHLFVINNIKDIISKHPNIHYVICGTGKLLDEYKQLISSLKLENNVHLLGFRNDVVNIMKASDIFLFPSIREGLPVSIIEAMACGMPIIASDIRGNNDLIKDGYNGLLYPVDDSTKFKESLLNLINDKDLQNKLSQQAYEDADQYSIEVIDPQILSLYK